MRIALHHLALQLGSDLIAAPLSPGDEELLLGRETLDGRTRVLPLRLVERQIRDLGARQVGDAFTEHQLAVVMDARLDEIAVELTRDTRGLLVKAPEIRLTP